jgi:gamma-glutamyltranspeptidase/glutathione hydrolase
MKHAISAGHDITLAVGKEILKAGGNAFDAATAAFFAMFITEPCMASAGGNGFALVKTKDDGVQYFDFFSQTPIYKNLKRPEFYPVTVDFGNETETFHIGLGSAAVPGTIAGILDIHAKFGTIPLAELIQPACKLARTGVVLDGFQAYDLVLLAAILKQDPRGREIFFKDGEIKKEGDRINMPHLVDLLEFIVAEGHRGFYEGDIAETIVRDSRERGGFLSMEDFKRYRVFISDPLQFPYRKHQVFVPNGPNNGGLSMALYLALSSKSAMHSAEAIQKTQEIIRQPKTAMKYMDKYYPGHNYIGMKALPSHRGTTHLNILDKEGNAIGLSCSIGEGCGYFIPGTDMQMNNMLGELYLLPGGKHSWERGIRLQSMMSPTMISDSAGKVQFVAGSGGAGRIPFAIGQVIENHFSKGMSLSHAIEAPRYHFQNEKVQVEGGAAWQNVDSSALVWDKKSLYFGGVHAISLKNDVVEAVGDSRRWGVGAVFD